MVYKKAFTLFEIIVVTMIVWILAWVLFRTYITISEISFRVEQQKIVNQEVLLLTQYLQNLANRNTIQYDKYNGSLYETKWIVDVLYMSWEDGTIEVFSSGNCIEISEDPVTLNLESACALFVKKNDAIIKLTSESIYISKSKFKIIPFDDYYMADIWWCQSNYLSCINNTWFRFLSKVYSKWYNSQKRSNRVFLSIQQFFNI